jgi:hypothetical protein
MAVAVPLAFSSAGNFQMLMASVLTMQGKHRGSSRRADPL